MNFDYAKYCERCEQLEQSFARWEAQNDTVYRFAITADNIIIRCTEALQRAAVQKYMDRNGLMPKHVENAMCGWRPLLEEDYPDWTKLPEDEQPDPLPPRYTGNRLLEYDRIARDITLLGCTVDWEITEFAILCDPLESANSISVYDEAEDRENEIPAGETLKLLRSLGYPVQTIHTDSCTFRCIR